MSFTIGEPIRAVDIFREFQTRVINTILTGPYNHLGNPGVVPVELLDYSNIISVDAGYNMDGYKHRPIVASNGSTVGSVYGALTYLSKLLLKLGSYDYHEYCSGSRGWSRHTTGRCMFSNYAVLQAFNVQSMDLLPLTPSNSGVSKNLALSLSSFNGLIQSCYQSVMNSSKVFLQIEDGRCHEDCYNNWSDSHSNTALSPPCNNGDVYENGPWAYKPGTYDFPDPGYHANSPGHSEDSGSSSYSCHTNDHQLSLRAESCNAICNIGFGGIDTIMPGQLIKPED